jgi:hypothetical protein
MFLLFNLTIIPFCSELNSTPGGMRINVLSNKFRFENHDFPKALQKCISKCHEVLIQRLLLLNDSTRNLEKAVETESMKFPIH